MAKCPVCSRDVNTPFFLNVDAWRWLACPHCAARLERKNPRFIVPLVSLYMCLLVLGQRGHRLAIVAEVLMVVTLGLMLAIFMRSQLQVRKPAPKAETTLDINSEAQNKR